MTILSMSGNNPDQRTIALDVNWTTKRYIVQAPSGECEWLTVEWKFNTRDADIGTRCECEQTQLGPFWENHFQLI